MQKYKKFYADPDYHDTFSNIQTCLRLNDWEEIGDGTHFLLFHMIGLFSFKEWSLPQAINFMWKFMEKLNIKPDYVTVHPHKLEEWKSHYSDYDIEIRLDEECIWSDGEIKGYCTEFYKDNIEIGNIVNTLGTSIDVGFGLERLLQVTNSLKPSTALEIVENSVLHLLNEGLKPSHNKSGYQIKKMLNYCILNGSLIKEEHFIQSRKNLIKVYENYLKLKDKNKYSGKGNQFWLDTFGIDLTQIKKYKMLKD